ncbi:GNAT family protein [Caloramator sp. mosi_1]|nr:GNAT family protein [Caloramator sp. mosi_1]WDC84804.1 GNAT family protein [Caloramator sp. mosi_1]
MSSDDYLKYAEWINDLEVSIGLFEMKTPITAEGERQIIEELSKENVFAIVLNEVDKLIGNVGLHNINWISRTAEIGILIGDKFYWGQGYAKEAMELLLDYAFNMLNLHMVYLKVYGYNVSAIRCYEKVGFKYAGRLREAIEVAGERYDVIYMDILKSEFKSVYM